MSGSPEPVGGRSSGSGSRLRNAKVQVGDRIRASRIKVTHAMVALRQDRLYRTSVLLVADNLLLGVLGGLFYLIATRMWAPQSIGVVAAMSGALSLVVVASTLGMPSTIVAYLASEPDQALMVRGALLATIPTGVALLAVLWLIPGHLGVPLTRLGVSTPWAVVLTLVLVVSDLLAAVIDPAFLARQEVSWSVGKDLAAMAFRFSLLFILTTRGTAQYLEVAVYYVASSAFLDLILLRWRIGRSSRHDRSFGVALIRSRARFAAGNQVAVLVSMLPTSLLPIIVLGHHGASSAAFVTIPMTIFGALTVVPSRTAQSLFAELSAHPEQLLEPIRKALRGAYLVTLPIAFLLIVAAPYLLDLFGRGYSSHGQNLLRWGAASSVFYCLNYVSDFVLLARKKVAAYLVANIVGTGFVLLSLLVAVDQGLGALGIGWFVGQGFYCAVSCIVLGWYVGRDDLLSTVRFMLR